MSGEEGSPKLRVCVLCIQCVCVCGRVSGSMVALGSANALFSLVANIRGPARHVMETLEI